MSLAIATVPTATVVRVATVLVGLRGTATMLEALEVAAGGNTLATESAAKGAAVRLVVKVGAKIATLVQQRMAAPAVEARTETSGAEAAVLAEREVAPREQAGREAEQVLQAVPALATREVAQALERILPMKSTATAKRRLPQRSNHPLQQHQQPRLRPRRLALAPPRAPLCR